MSLNQLKSIRGMNDILPEKVYLWNFIEKTIKKILNQYGYQNIRTPLLEYTKLFKNSIGNITDIVEKEMYSFVDSLNNQNLTLRPENTAAIARSSIEHNLLYNGPKRLWYIGPMYRHERPQKGRYRQFHQIGIEALGFIGPDIDIETILISNSIIKKLNIKNIQLEINSLGEIEERIIYQKKLILYFKKYDSILDEHTKQKIKKNPLRILDSKNTKLRKIIKNAPKLINYLGNKSKNNFKKITYILKKIKIPFIINPYLVRGLDYYNNLVFEWKITQYKSQNTIIAGGRYDTLFEKIGGKKTFACGWALGIERIINLLDKKKIIKNNNCDIYIIYDDNSIYTKAIKISEKLRNIGLKIILNCNKNEKIMSIKSQNKQAYINKSLFSITITQKKLLNNIVLIKEIKKLKNNKSKIIKQYIKTKNIKIFFKKAFNINNEY